MKTQPSIADHIEHAPTLADLLALLGGLERDPAFQRASTTTRRRWREAAFKRIAIWILTAPTAQETTRITNSILTGHSYDAPAEWKEALQQMAKLRRAELTKESNHRPTKT